MRVCFVTRRFFPTISGMSVYAWNLLKHLLAADIQLTVIAEYRGDDQGRGVYGGGPPIDVPGVDRVIGLESLGEQKVNEGLPADFEFDLNRIAATIQAEHCRTPFDLIHAQYGYPTGLASMMAAAQIGVPCVVSIQGGDGHWVGTCCSTHRDAIRAVFDHADALIIGCESFADEVIGNHGTARDRFTIVPGATDIERFFPPNDHRPGRSLADGPLRLLYHGRVDRRKGVLDLLEAVALLKNDPLRRHQFRLVISGIGPDVESTRKAIAELELADVVEMTGYADYDAVPKIYRSCDLFLSPTYSEGFSNTILEAMACGLPVISTRTVGVVDCLVDGVNGLLIDPQDISGLSRAIARLIDDPSLRARIADQALHDVRTRYCWPAVSRQIREVYDRLRGTEPDRRWIAKYDPSQRTVETSDPTCRFRRDPHLL